jgi:hypothetical protein
MFLEGHRVKGLVKYKESPLGFTVRQDICCQLTTRNGRYRCFVFRASGLQISARRVTVMIEGFSGLPQSNCSDSTSNGRFLHHCKMRDYHSGGYKPPKRRMTFNGLHVVISQKMVLLQHSFRFIIHYSPYRLILYRSGIQPGAHVPPGVREDILGCT